MDGRNNSSSSKYDNIGLEKILIQVFRQEILGGTYIINKGTFPMALIIVGI